MIKIFCIDDDNRFLDALEVFFESSRQVEMTGSNSQVATEEDVKFLLEDIQERQPDIILMDFDFHKVGRPEDYGVTLTKRILEFVTHAVKIIMFATNEVTKEMQLDVIPKVRRSFQAGAVAYMSKEEPGTWIECISEVHKSTVTPNIIPDIVVQRLRERLLEGVQYHLTVRETEAIRHLSNDKKVQEIARLMGDITFSGVTFHLNNAKVKLNVTTHNGLVGKALRYGVIY